MSNAHQAREDFDRAYRKALWRKILGWFTGRPNHLLSYDELRSRLRIRGQRYLGLQQVPLDAIIGSVGRYQDFDREFLPTQVHTRDRWVNIDRARYADISLPPVDLLKIGQVYFVRDGNHRISVARERGQEFIDAYVTEIEVPVPVTPDADLDALALAQERLDFLETTRLQELCPGAQVEASLPGQYPLLLEHISAHRWLLGEQRQEPVSWEEAVRSWYTNVYEPVAQVIREHGLLESFPGSREADLYLWISRYQWYLRQAHQTPEGATAPQDALPPVRRLARLLRNAPWLDELMRQQEYATFLAHTHLQEHYPDVDLRTTLPGGYDRLREHISTHRWFLGEERQAEVPYAEAALSWYEQVYLPLVTFLREERLPQRYLDNTEADLYLWVSEGARRWQEP